MNPIAIYSGSLVIYWSAIVITLGIAAGFLLSYGVHVSHGGTGAAMWVFLPFATVFSVLLSRLIHWYCHMEQYGGFFSALLDYSMGGYCLPGVLFGVILAAFLVAVAKGGKKPEDAPTGSDAVSVTEQSTEDA